MSYQIIFDRQFVKSSNGISVLVLMGSNNCQERFLSGRYRTARDWCPLCVEESESQILAYFRSMCREDISGYKGEHFKFNGRWIDDKALMNWVDIGFKNARTIEEIREVKAYIYLRCKIITLEDHKWSEEMVEDINTTKDLDRWIVKAKERKSLKRDTEIVSIVMAFNTGEPLRLGIKMKKESPVIVKIGKKYYYDGEWVSADISKAFVYNNINEARSAVGNIGNAHFIDASNKSKVIKPRNFVIRVSDGCNTGLYVYKKTKNTLHFCVSPECVKSFLSEKEAMRYINKYLAGRFPNSKSFLVENVLNN